MNFDLASNWDADYAILVLQKPVTTNKYIKMAKLPTKDAKCPPGHTMVVSGWGDDWYPPGRPTNKLWAVLQTCLPMDKCPKLKQKKLTEKYFVCAGDPIDDDNSACRGDSGGTS